MKSKTINFFQATRPLEYVSFFNLNFSTKEGPAYTYFAVDAYSEYAFSTGVEPDEKAETILKHIYLLTEQPDFIKKNHIGFTIVLDKYKELETQMNALISKVNGKLLFHPEFHKQISLPVIKSFKQYLVQTNNN